MQRLKSVSRFATSFALLGGLVFFVWLVYKIGTGPVVATFRGSPLRALGIVLAYGLFQAAYSFGWSLTLRPKRLSFPQLFLIYQSGDTVSYAFPMAGEAMKVALLRPAYPTIEGLFSVSVAKFCEFVAQLLFYLIAVPLALFAFPLPAGVRLTGVALSAGLAAALAVLFRMQRKGLYGPVLSLAEKLIRGDFSEETRQKVGEVDRMISRFYGKDPSRFAAVVFFKLIGKMGGVVEAALVLLLLGHRPTVALAFAVETLSMIVNDLFFFIPGRVGGAEGGRTAVFMMLGYTAAEGLTYAVLRRVRELFWIGIGLAYLTHRRLRRPKALKAVVFDFDGTLDAPGRPRRERLYEAFAREKVCEDRAAFDRAWLRADALLKRSPEAGRKGLRDLVAAQVDALFAEVGVDGNGRRRAIAEAFLAESEKGIERSSEVLRRLKAKCRVGILDNFYGNLGLVCLESGLAESVDVVVDSNAVGFEKPEPEIFEVALARMGLEPEEVLYVGDSPEEDMRGAKSAGLRHAWLRRPGAEGELCCREDRPIGSIEEVEGLLGAPAS